MRLESELACKLADLPDWNPCLFAMELLAVPLRMPISPLDLLRLARQLGQHTNDEASVCSAVSRAYYAGLPCHRANFSEQAAHGQRIKPR